MNVNDLRLAATVRRATPADAAALAALVNRAYAVEAFFVDGERTNPAEVAPMTERGTFVVLERAGGGLAAAVHVAEIDRDTGYFGMLSVDPALQGLGLGTRLVRIAEGLALARGGKLMTLQIVNLRDELGRWYRSLGYREIGTAPYTHRPAKKPCHFVHMQKEIAA